MFKDSGLEVCGYRYFDKKTVGLDFEGLKADLLVRSSVHPGSPRTLTCNIRLHQRVLLFYYMLVHTTLLVLTPPLNNGPPSPTL